MKEQELGYQLEQGLKQLQMNIEALRRLHSAKGLDLSAPYTLNTENLLKIEFAHQALKSLAAPVLEEE